MRYSTRLLGLTVSIGLAVAATSTLYAAGSHGSREPTMGHGGMMDMMRSMGSMMGTMGGMMGGKDMMEGCPMMSGGQHTPKPNEQWREKPPATPKQGS